MGALRVNLTDGTSTYIDLTDATLVRSTNNNANQFDIEVQKPSGTINYQVIRFNSSPSTASEGVTWRIGMDVAYAKIAIDPIRYGYPDLGGSAEAYMAYDDEKFLAAAISSALDNSQEPAVLSNRTAISSGVSGTAEGKDLVGFIDNFWNDAQAEAADIEASCLDKTTNGDSFVTQDCDCPSLTPGVPGPSGENTACCQACANKVLSSAKEQIAATGGDIIWRHQYLYDSVGAEA
jgi:hypothetical protein